METYGSATDAHTKMHAIILTYCRYRPHSLMCVTHPSLISDCLLTALYLVAMVHALDNMSDE